MKNKIKLGVMGCFRGKTMFDYCLIDDNMELVAVCDFNEKVLKNCDTFFKEKNANVAMYKNFDDFINHDMDAVILANFATEHAPFAIKCLNKGLNVMSEVLPCQTLQEAVELVEAVEKSNKIYSYAENYCYFPATIEMKKIYQSGALGNFEYGEGEYIHNCESIWPDITYGDANHWRNNMYATFYCTHSIGPLVHITGLRPIKVVGLEFPFTDRCMRMGCKSGIAGMEIITMENGGIVKSIHGNLSKNSIWYSVYGDKAKIESGREFISKGVEQVSISQDESPINQNTKTNTYNPIDENSYAANRFTHTGSDWYTIHNFIKAINGEKADTIDVYEALDMFLPGMFAYYSILQGGITLDIPNFRNKKERELYRNDTRCTDKKIAKEQLIPSYSKGIPEIPNCVYEKIKETHEKKQ